LSSTDNLLWTIGRDPILRTPVVAVLLLDRSPRWDQVRGRFQELTEAVPRLRSRVEPVSALGWGRPMWVAHDGFDLDVHLRRMVAASPATLRTVLDLAQVMGTTAFDPELPLWEAVVVEGIAGSQAALVIKLHHALVDGVGGMDLVLHLLDRSRAPRRGAAKVDRAPGTPGHREGGSSDETGRPAWLQQVLPTSRRVWDASARALRDPLAQINRARSMGESVGRLLAPARRPLSSLMTARSLGRRFDVLDLSPDLLRETAIATGGTMNDVFVTAVVRGLWRYHHDHDSEAPHLRVLMPVNVRSDSDDVGGNHFVPARFILPTCGGPGECLHRVHEIAESWKHAPGLGLSDILASALDHLPPSLTTALWGSMLKGDDFVATNVPGPRIETYLAGAHVDRFYAFAPTSGAALNVALVTAAGRACVGINSDTAAIADGVTLTRCLQAGFDEVFTLAHSRRRKVSA